MSYFDWPMTAKKIETLEVPQNIGFYWKMECLPFARLYRSKENNFGQSIWDKKCGGIRNILGNSLGT
jgi:hypothetical protein